MSLNLDRNGSYIQRRKMYIQFPNCSLNSYVDLNWQDEEEKRLEKLNHQIKMKKQQELESIKQNYNSIVERRLAQKYKYDTYRVIPDQISLQRDRDSLNQQIENFNNSKIMANPISNPQHEGANNNVSHVHNAPQPQQTQSNYIQQTSQPLQQQPQQYSQQYTQQQYPPTYPQSPSYSSYSPKVSQTPPHRQSYIYNSKDHYDYDLMKEYAKFNDIYNGDPSKEKIFRNVHPDKLQNFLRQRSKIARQRPLNVSLNLNSK